MSSRVDRVLFGAMALLQLVPIWVATAFVTQDGPTHVSTARRFWTWSDPELTVLHAFYTFQPHLEPNWLGHLLLAPLVGVLPPVLAEKIFVSGYVLALPLAAAWACAAFGRDRAYAGLLVVPFAHNLLLHLGFYNFCTSLVLFFVVVGYWCRRAGAFTLRSGAVFAGLTVLLFFSHGFGTMVTVLTLFALTASLAVHGALGTESGRVRALLGAPALPTLLACLPLFALGAQVMASRNGAVEVGPHYGFARLAAMLARLDVLVVHLPALSWLTSGLALGFLVLTLALIVHKVRHDAWQRWDVLLVAAGWLGAVYFWMPAQLINRWANFRMMPFVFFALVLWMAAQPPMRWLRGAVISIAVATALPLAAFHVWHRLALDPLVRSFLSVESQLEPNTTLAPLVWDQNYAGDRLMSFNVRPFNHAAGYLAASRGLVEFTDYEANFGVFPFAFRPQANPYLLLGGNIERLPSCLSFRRFENLSGIPVDYVMMFNVADTLPGDRCTRRLVAQLEQRYVLVERGWRVLLYQRRK